VSAIALKQWNLFVPGANPSHSHIHVSESHDFTNFRGCYYSDEDATAMTFLVEEQGAQEHFAIFLFSALCACLVGRGSL